MKARLIVLFTCFAFGIPFVPQAVFAEAPKLTAGGTLGYTENDSATAIDTSITLTDGAPPMVSATVQITENYQTARDKLAFADTADINGAWDAEKGILTLTGKDTIDNYQAALRSVTYENSSDDPDTGDRTVTWIVNDGEVDSNAPTSTIQVTAVNDAPVITAGATLDYTENDAASVIDNTITVTDDDTNLESATITITGNYQNGQDKLAFVNTGNITGNWDADNGVLTLSGSDSLADYQVALRSITYRNTSEDPVTLDRTVTWIVNDGDLDSNSATSTIQVTAVNDAPVITDDGLADQPVDDNATIAVFATGTGLGILDVDDDETLTITVTITNGLNRGDFSAGTVGGWSRATVTDHIKYTKDFNAVDPDGNAETEIRAMVFDPRENAVAPGNTEETEFFVSVFDGEKTTASDAEISVIATSINDAPVLDNSEDMTLTAIDEDDTTNNGNLISEILATGADGDPITDADTGAQEGIAVTGLADNNGIWQYKVGGGAWTDISAAGVAVGSALLLRSDDDRIRFVPNPDYDGSDTGEITFRAWDRTGGAAGDNDADTTSNGGFHPYSTNTANASITVNPVNDPPVITGGGTLDWTEDDGPTPIDGTVTVEDVDDANLEGATIQISGNYETGQDILAYAGGLASSWNEGSGTLSLSGSHNKADYEAALRSITFNNTSDNPSTATRTVTWTLNDGDTYSAGATSTITVTRRYTLTIDPSPADGKVTSDVFGLGGVVLDCPGTCFDEYVDGREVTLTPVPDAGYAFSGWSGAVSGTSSPYILTMDTDKSVSASFEAKVDCSPEVDQRNYGYNWTYLGTYRFAAGTASYVTLEHEGDGTVSFDAIRFRRTTGGDEVILDNEDDNQQNGDGTWQVLYAPSEDWEDRSDGNAYAHAGDGSPTYARTYNTGDKVTLTPELAGGVYEVHVQWREYDNRDRTAHYCIYNYTGHTITSSAGENGAITPLGSQAFDTGEDQVYTITPNDGYLIDDVVVDGASVKGQLDDAGVAYTFTFYAINRDHTIEATFIPEDANTNCVEVNQQFNAGEWYLLGTYRFAAGTGGWVTLTREHDGDEGSSTCADAIRFSPTGGGDDVIVDNGDAEYTETGGSWSNSSGSDYYGTVSRFADEDGDSATWKPDLPEAGIYEVYAWWTNAGTRDTSASYCIHNLQGNVITVTAGENGDVTGDPNTVQEGGTVIVPSGEDQIFEMAPYEGYTIEYVLVDGTPVDRYEGVSGTTSYTFPDVQDDHTFEVGFTVAEENVTCIPVNQQEDGYDWTTLGTFRFPGGSGAFVTLTHDGGGTVSHDAVKFTPVESGSDIIVDDLDPESVYESGNWTEYDHSSAYGGTYHYTNVEGARVTIAPDLPAAGEYEVSVRWRGYSSRDDTAEYCVHNHMGQIIAATAGANGVIATSGVTIYSNTTQRITVLSGATRTFTMHPDEGYTIQDVIVDGESVGGTTTYTFTNVTYSHSIEASFEDHGDDCDNATLLECGSGVSGTISPAGDVDYFQVEFAGSGRYTFYTQGSIDTSGRLLDAYCTEITSDDDSGEDTNFSITEDLDAGTYHIEVAHSDPDSGTGEYTLKLDCEHVIRASARSGGDIVPEGDIVLSAGSGATFTITPDSGNTIYDVRVDGVSIGAVGSYSFANVNENHTIEAIFTLPPATCNDISDVPLDALTRGVGALIMFVLDDSGSMDWEFMTGEGDGKFGGYEYVFDDPGDNVYTSGGNSDILNGDDRGRWKSQWSGYNRIYYNPKTTYVPWPTLPDADPDNPRSHPDNTSHTFNLDTTYHTVQQAVVVDNEGTYDGDNRFTDDGTGGEFTATKEAWIRSAGVDWYGSDPPRSMYTGTSGATASWTPDLPHDGQYAVYVWYTDSGNRDREAPYQIVHDSGETWVDKDQEYNDGTWVSLGTYTFSQAGYAYGPSGVTVHRYDDGDAPPADSSMNNHDSGTCADAMAFIPVGAGSIDIPRAHYYTLADDNGNGEYDSGETVYLVSLNGTTSSMDYYEVDMGDNLVGFGDLTPVAEADAADSVRPRNPNGSYRSYTEERQNFANWYSFYRRRELTAIAAISRTIYDLDTVYVGFRSINGRIKQPVLPINVDGEDELSTLLTTLYEYEGGEYNTPLRRGLEHVGEYFDQEDANTGDLGSGVTSPWKDQEQGGECQQAFAIVMTDGYYNGSSPYVGNVDEDNGEPYADAYSNTLADVAMEFYENDLVSALNNEVPANPYDNATHQHMVTYSVSFGVIGTLDPDFNPETERPYDVHSGVTEDYPIWPSPTSGSQEKIDDLWHAAVNGRGQYLSAGDPDELINSLTSIMANIAARTGSASSVSINGDQLYGVLGEEVRIFQASYSSGTMSGDVKSYRIDQDTGDVLMDDPVWAAAELLDDRVETYGHTDRIIVTMNLSAGGDGIPFTYDSISSSGTSEQLTHLTPDWSSSAAATTENLINYIRGERTHEFRHAGPFRDRASRLGDLVHSSPYYYNNMLYVGGNDGMLHALDAETGEEMFAYVPGLVYDNLKDYGNPEYTHKFYVDLTPHIREGVDFSGTHKTVLMGGLGKGGKGYYALDITDLSGSTSFTAMSESAMANRVLWEFPDSGATSDFVNDMGYSYSKAYIVKSNDTDDAPWVAIFGNGYNSENSSAVLFIVDPTDGSLIKQIDTGVTNCNGLSSPALLDFHLDDNGERVIDGTVDYVYAGDLQGNLWKFDLSSDNHDEWGVAFGGATPQPLFHAQGPSGSLQPITTEPDLMRHCDESKGGFMIIFGTGKYLGGSDLNDTSTQAAYGIWDYGDDEDEYLGTFESGSTPQLTNQPDSVSLLEQTFTEHTDTIEVDTNGDGELDGTEEMTFQVLSGNTPTWSVTTNGDPLVHAGWYAEFAEEGERMISDPLIRLGLLTYITFIPEESPCGGEGYSFPVFADPCSGGNYGEAVFDITEEGIIDELDLVNLSSDPENFIHVPPSSKKFAGRLQPPAIVRMPGAYGESRDKYFLSSSLGEIVTVTAKSPKIGIIYWKDMKVMEE